jgi:hypothetical protein
MSRKLFICMRVIFKVRTICAPCLCRSLTMGLWGRELSSDYVPGVCQGTERIGCCVTMLCGGRTDVHHEAWSGRTSVITKDSMLAFMKTGDSLLTIFMNISHVSRSVLYENVNVQLQYRKICAIWLLWGGVHRTCATSGQMPELQWGLCRKNKHMLYLVVRKLSL